MDIKPTWSAISNIRGTLAEILSPVSSSINDSVQIAATELLENAIKYRSAKSKDENIKFEFNYDHNEIEIKVSNKFENDDDFRRLLATFSKIKEESNPKLLYVERLKELFDNENDKHNRLGLFRVIYESGFGLNCYQEESEITVVASKILKEIN
ncbi:hypothetical protein AB3N58_17615 (plasmid) [Leptospira sp. WS60.C2]